MENYIVINGKKAELTEEQLEKLGIKSENLEEKYPAKFKVGDRVKVINSTRTLGRKEEYKGKIFTIDYVYKLSDYPDGPAPNIRACSIGQRYVVYENELELASYEKMFDKRARGEPYFYIAGADTVCTTTEAESRVDDNFFNCASYCGDENILQQRALHDTLNRLLWRAGVIAGELDNGWNMNNTHYYIYRDFDSDCLKIDCVNTWKHQGTCYFPTEDSARAALGNIVMPFLKEHPDFVW